MLQRCRGFLPALPAAALDWMHMLSIECCAGVQASGVGGGSGGRCASQRPSCATGLEREAGAGGSNGTRRCLLRGLAAFLDSGRHAGAPTVGPPSAGHAGEGGLQRSGPAALPLVNRPLTGTHIIDEEPLPSQQERCGSTPSHLLASPTRSSWLPPFLCRRWRRQARQAAAAACKVCNRPPLRFRLERSLMRP